MPPTTISPIGAGIFEEQEIDYQCIRTSAGGRKRDFHLFVEYFFDCLRTTQHNPVIPTNFDFVYLAILLSPCAKLITGILRKAQAKTDKWFAFGTVNLVERVSTSHPEHNEDNGNDC